MKLEPKHNFFSKLLSANPVFSADWTIKVVHFDKTKSFSVFPVHKLLLTCSSSVFATLFNSSFSDTETLLELTSFESSVMERIIIKYMYCSEIEINNGGEYACALTLARYFQMNELETLLLTSAEFSKKDQAEYYLSLVANHPTLALDDKSKKTAISELANDFETSSDDALMLPSDIITELLSSSTLRVNSEDAVYLFVKKYISTHQNDLHHEQITELWMTVRSHLLSGEYLLEFQENENLDISVLRECVRNMARWKLQSSSPDSTDVYHDIKPRPRSTSAKWTLNPSKKNPRLALSNNNMTVSTSAKGHASVLGTQGFSSGVHTWNVCIEGINSHWIGIGVCELANLTSDLTSDYSFFWGCSSANQTYKATGTLRTLSVGETITVSLDCDNGNLSLVGPGTHLTASGLQGKTLYPIINLYDTTNKVTIAL